MNATDKQTGPMEDGWGTRPTEQRQVELEEMLHEWEVDGYRCGRCAPFDGKELDGADVFWLAIRAASHSDKAEVERFLRTPLTPDFPGFRIGLLALSLPELHLEGANLHGAHLEGANLHGAHLEGANLHGAHLKGVDLRQAHLKRAFISKTQLERARLGEADLAGADLAGADLARANLHGAHLEGANLNGAHLEGADLKRASFDRNSSLDDARFNHATLCYVIFDNVDLSGVRWQEVRKLGDEWKVGRWNRWTPRERQYDYRVAAQSYRALSVALRNQGITESARFHYRSEVMKRKALFWETFDRLSSRSFYRAPLSFVSWFVSWVLGTFMGYGDYISRLFLTYAVVVVAFAAIYLGVDYQPVKGHLLAALPWQHTPVAVPWLRDLLSFCIVRVPAAIHVSTPSHLLDMLVFSVTAFHGRGLQQMQNPSEIVIWWAGLEAVLGLLIEALFVAAFARRVTGG